VKAYDPEATPEAAAWLALDEQLRLALVEQYHQWRRIRVPNVRAHAVMHAIVENQLAENDGVVTETLLRLQHEGTSPCTPRRWSSRRTAERRTTESPASPPHH
jgi:hypothetical protein